MAEKLTLTVPDSATPPAPDYIVAGFEINMGYVKGPAGSARDDAHAYITVLLVSSNLQFRQLTLWSGAQAVSIARQFNTLNLSAKSLEKRLLERVAVLDAKYAGVISGAPDAP